jgi:hypothetical protein
MKASSVLAAGALRLIPATPPLCAFFSEAKTETALHARRNGRLQPAASFSRRHAWLTQFPLSIGWRYDNKTENNERE